MSYVINITGGIDHSHIVIVQDAISILSGNLSLELKMHIDSNGGDPDAAKHIYDILAPYRGRITAITNAKCMSCAVLIYLAADTRLAGPNADFMIHPTSWTLWGAYSFLKTYRSLNTGDLTLTLAEVYTLQAQLNTATKRLLEIEKYTDEILSARAKLTEKQFRDRGTVNTDQHFTPKESLQLGISTGLI